jgi:HlyD family secretion protein
MKKVLGALVLVLVVAGLVVLNQSLRRDDGKSVLFVAPQVELAVDVALPTQAEIVRTVQAPGDVEAYSEVDISSELVAKIVEMPVGSGSVVEKGDLLCRLDDADFRARVKSGEANVAKLQALVRQAEADYGKADRDLNRQIRLSESASTSALELADYRTAFIRAETALEMRRQELIEAEALLQSAREDLAKTVITAPISGVVSEAFAKEGEVVVTGTMNNPGTRIMVLSDLSKMIVRCRVDETDAALVKEGQPARIYLQSNTRQSIAGEVTCIATKGVKPTGRDVVNFETLILITEQDDRVKPGMTANVEIEVARKDDALTVPVESVVYRKRRDLPEDLIAALTDEQDEDTAVADEHRALYVKLIFCAKEGKAEPRLVETGINDARRVEILEGVAFDDTIITGPYRCLDQLKKGSAVKHDALEEPAAVVKSEASDDAPEDGLADMSSSGTASVSADARQ